MKRSLALKATCPTCLAEPGVACIGSAGQARASVHRARLKVPMVVTNALRRPAAPEFGFDLLKSACIKHLSDQFDEEYSDPWWGDTEIERLFMMALIMRLRVFKLGDCLADIHIVPDAEVAAGMMNDSDDSGTLPLIVVPQFQLPGWRVDYLVLSRGVQRRGWHSLIIECDGHDFHERTKEQAARDRSRDRDAQLLGYTVFRFTGSEIWRDAWACSERVVDWAMRHV